MRSTGIVDGRFLNAVDVRAVDDAMLTQIAAGDPDDPLDDLLLVDLVTPDLDAALLASRRKIGVHWHIPTRRRYLWRLR